MALAVRNGPLPVAAGLASVLVGLPPWRAIAAPAAMTTRAAIAAIAIS
jgi:hypothetical protein